MEYVPFVGIVLAFFAVPTIYTIRVKYIDWRKEQDAIKKLKKSVLEDTDHKNTI